MQTTGHKDEQNKDHPTVIDYFYQKSIEYEMASQKKKEEEDKLRITMFAKHAGKYNEDGIQKGFFFGDKGDQRA